MEIGPGQAEAVFRGVWHESALQALLPAISVASPGTTTTPLSKEKPSGLRRRRWTAMAAAGVGEPKGGSGGDWEGREQEEAGPRCEASTGTGLRAWHQPGGPMRGESRTLRNHLIGAAANRNAG